MVSIGSGTSSDLRLPGTALNHVTINGIDKLLSNGSTEISLNGIEVTQDSNLLHGDILTLPSLGCDSYRTKIALVFSG